MRVESGLQSALHPHTVRLSVEWRYQRLWWYNWSSWWWAACCSKHVEECSVTYIYCWRLKELCTKLVFWKVYALLCLWKQQLCNNVEEINYSVQVLLVSLLLLFRFGSWKNWRRSCPYSGLVFSARDMSCHTISITWQTYKNTKICFRHAPDIVPDNKESRLLRINYIWIRPSRSALPS